MHKKIKRFESGKNLSQFEFFSRMVAWLERYFTSAGHMATIMKVLSRMFHIRNTRGDAEGIRYAKETRHELLKVLEEHSYESLSSNGRTKIKFPKGLRILKQIKIDKFYPFIRLLLSTLSVFRFLRGDGTPSFKTIQEGSSQAGIPTDVENNIVPFLRSLSLNPVYFGKRVKKLEFKKYSMTVKTGPKGHALWTSFLDLLHLPDDLKQAIGRVGGSKLQEDMSNYPVLVPFIRDLLDARLARRTSTALRRLSVIRDKEGKNREIAILDYYSQQALRPLHQYLFKLLAKIPQDCTFDQGKNLLTLKPTKGSSYHSLDLSSATDRFPIEVQQKILETLFGKEYADDWKTIMVGYPFEYQGQMISYARGNPMGAYSSWSAFALAHHFFVYTACKNAGIRWRDCPYMLLGDDIVIADDKVAQEYIIILQRFDVPFNEGKSHRSPYLFEFAKRFVHCGTEISPFPLAGLYENRNNWLLAIGTIFEESSRKRWIPRVDMLHSCLGYLERVGFSSSFISERKPYIELILRIRNSFAGNESMAGVVRHLAFLLHGKQFAEGLHYLSDEFLESKVLLVSFSEMFRESVSKLSNRPASKPLGAIASEIMEAAMMADTDANPFDLTKSCPIISLSADIVDIFRLLHSDCYNVEAIKDQSSIRKYRDLFIQISIPTSDESFYMRRKDVLQLATSRLADKVLSLVREAKDEPQLIYPMIF
jgi:hypothetical protein